MRFVSLGICTVVALACGDGDQIMIDPNFRDPAQPAANASPGSEEDGSKREADGLTTGGDGAMASEPGHPECGDAPASAGACSENPTDDAASTDTELPASSGGSGNDGNVGSAGAGGGGGGSKGGGSKGSGAAGGGSKGSGAAGGGSKGSGAAGGGAEAGSSGDATGAGGSAGNPDNSGGDDGDGEYDSGAGGGTGNEPGPLPDLILDGAYLMATIQQDVVDASADQCLFNEGCVTGDGLRRVVRFGTRSANVGDADVVVGEPVAGNPLWEFDACHQHFHFEGYARYDLVDPKSGQVLPIGNKNGFCLRDLDSWSNPSCATYDCDYQGISVGCADVYTPDLDCQWVDITDVAPGTYDLVVTVNTDRSIQESSFDNNSATVSIEILPDTVRVIP